MWFVEVQRGIFYQVPVDVYGPYRYAWLAWLKSWGEVHKHPTAATRIFNALKKREDG